MINHNYKRAQITDELVVMCCLIAKNNRIDLRECNTYDVLKTLTRYPDKVIFAAMRRTHDRGYIEYSTSITNCWPTKDGLAMLDMSFIEHTFGG